MIRRRSPVALCVMLISCAVGTRLFAQPEISDEDRLYKMAQSYETSGDLPSAARIYQELLEIDPDSRSYFDGLQRVWLQLGRFDALAPIVEKRLERYADDVDLLILHAELLQRAGNASEADAAWAKALEVGGRDVDTYIKVGQSQMQLRLFDKAVGVYELARKRFGRNMVIADRLARLYAILGEYGKSANEYVDLLAEGPGRLGYVQAGLSLITDTPAGVEAAIRVTEHLAEARKDHPEYLELLAWLYSEKGDDSSAFVVVTRLDRKRGGRGSEIYAFADRMLRGAKYDQAIRAFEYFLANFDRNHALTPSVMYSYVYALQQQYGEEGNLSKEAARELIARYREVLEYGRDGSMGEQARLAIARLQADVLNEPEEGLKTLDREPFDRRSPHALEGLLLSADLTLQTASIEEARQRYRRAAEQPASAPDAERLRDVARLRYAETFLYSGDFTEGVDSLTALTDDVGSDAANDALAWLFLLQEHLEQNRTALEHYVEGRYRERRRDWEGVITAAEAAVKANPEGTLADDAMFMKAAGLRRREKYEEASEAALRIVEVYPDGTHAEEALFLAAEIADVDMKQTGRALELYTRILVEFPASQRTSEVRERIRLLRGEGS